MRDICEESVGLLVDQCSKKSLILAKAMLWYIYELSVYNNSLKSQSKFKFENARINFDRDREALCASRGGTYFDTRIFSI